jgi:hypothetical protein
VGGFKQPRSADDPRRRLFERTLTDVTLVTTKRKPFDQLAKRLKIKNSRGERPCTFVSEIIGLPLALSVFPKVYDFSGDAVLSLVEPGLYKKGRRAKSGTS